MKQGKKPRRSSRLGLLAATVACALMTVGPVSAETSASSDREVRSSKERDKSYSHRRASRGGTGKFYMGREISLFLTYHGIPWLEREDRFETEKPDLVIEALELSPTDVVADVGAGSGYFTFRLGPKVPQGKVLAVDIQKEMLAAIEQRRDASGMSQVVPILGTETDPGLPPSAVDIVLMVDVYHELSHPKEMMAGILQSLKPDGQLVLVEYRGEDRFSSIHPLHKMTQKQIKKEMKAAGLSHVKTLDFLPEQHVMFFQRASAGGSR